MQQLSFAQALKVREGSRKLNRDFIKMIMTMIQKPSRDSLLIHTLYSYPAKFQASVPQAIIENLTQENDLVLDPYGGGGTTSAACRHLNRSAVHYDMSPISCMIAKSKTNPISNSSSDLALSLLQNAEVTKSATVKLLTNEEFKLLGTNVSQAVESTWQIINKLIRNNNSAAPLLGTVLLKLIKLAGRRDASARREKSPKVHMKWIHDTFQEALQELKVYDVNTAQQKIVCASNHSIKLGIGSVDLIVTSPPYPGVDVEYSQVQFQRRDLNRCFRSDVGSRIAAPFFKGVTSKKHLCSGGAISTDYFSNSLLSIKEMRRVLKLGAFAFIYIGFKTEIDRKRYEKQLEDSGFSIIERGNVQLSNDRVASSRSTHHGKNTKMMKSDFLYILK